MIPRYQKIVFSLLLVVSIVMAAVLVRQLERAHDRLLHGEDIAPTTAPAVAPAVDAKLMVANDGDGTLVSEGVSLPLPKDDGARARALLEKLLEIYASPGAAHPVTGVPKPVLAVFLMPAPEGRAGKPAGAKDPVAREQSSGGRQLAVVNLTGAFADGHPSGIETETLTVLSICGTLHENLPRVMGVRFLVDGAPRATLAGHADLSQTYLTGDSAPETQVPEGQD